MGQRARSPLPARRDRRTLRSIFALNPMLRSRRASMAALVGALLSVLLAVTAYQVRPSFDIGIGSKTDAPLLQGFNAPETAATGKDFHFRWSSGDASIILSDLGRQSFQATLSVSGSRPPGNPPPHLRVTSGGQTLLEVDPPAGDPTDYRFKVPESLLNDAGSLALRLQTNAFTPPGDPRQLGLIVSRLQLQPTGSGFVVPQLGSMTAAGASSLLLGLVAALLGWGPGGALLFSLLPGLLASSLLAFDRLWLTTAQWYVTWLPVLSGGLLLILVAGSVCGWVLRRIGSPWTPLERRLLLMLVLLVFAIRLAGQLHPEIFIVDLGFHAHRFETIQSGTLLFKTVNTESGTVPLFYLPTAYVFMLPLQWITKDDYMTIRIFTVTMATLGAFLVFCVGKRALSSGRAGLCAAVLYTTVPMAVLPFSWGITTNIFGEFFALLSLAIAVCAPSNLRPGKLPFWLLVCSLFVTLLSHPGVIQLAGLAFALMGALWWLRRRRLESRWTGALTLFALVLAAIAAYVAYFNHFIVDTYNTLRDLQVARAASARPGVTHLLIGGSVVDKSLGLTTRYATSR
ncbi:MAG: hypothetical protein M3014_09690, partial [Chloroflexota bacterium]|nr:hypothetical protein [Chloroflexota bacterium]